MPASVQRYPMLRLVIPLILGIVAGYVLFVYGGQILFSSLFPFLAGYAIVVCCLWFSRRYALRWLFGVVVSLFLVWTGVWLFQQEARKVVFDFPDEETAYYFRLTEEPERKARSMLCKGYLPVGRDSAGEFAVERHVLLYLAVDSLSSSLVRGDELWISARVRPPANRGNPDEFDYAWYLFRCGISGTGFVPSGKWQLARHSDTRTLYQIASDVRGSVLDLYRKLGFEGETYAVLAAVTLGYKQELSEEIRNTYAATGASHILALSGLHIGFLYLLFYYLLVRPVRHRPGIRVAGLLVLILLLWGFAFLTGLSPSVVRSVVMFSLLALSLLLPGQALSLNTWAAAGFLMLLFQPFWLMDVGFQLSFSAVAAILCIQSWLYGKWRIDNPVGRYLWGLTTVSVAAQIGTLPLILYYFSRFPVWGLLTNLLVVPMVSLWIWTAVGMLLLTPFPGLQQWVAAALGKLIGLTHQVLSVIERWPLAVWEQIRVTLPEVILCYLLLFLVGWYVAGRRFSVLRSILILSLCWVCFHSWESRRKHAENSLLFYHLSPESAVHCVSSEGASWVVSVSPGLDEERMKRTLNRYWSRLRLPPPQFLYETYCSAEICWQDPLLHYGGKSIVVVREDHWRSMQRTEPYAADYLYISGGYTGTLEELLCLFRAETVILDASLPEYRLQRLITACETCRVEYFAISRKGSLRIAL
ncbi:MAG: competence protein ComEC family protein [Bacteroides sp.]|nr:competence protein ComEC family protein [Bacteroides sp.]